MHTWNPFIFFIADIGKGGETASKIWGGGEGGAEILPLIFPPQLLKSVLVNMSSPQLLKESKPWFASITAIGTKHFLECST